MARPTIIPAISMQPRPQERRAGDIPWYYAVLLFAIGISLGMNLRVVQCNSALTPTGTATASAKREAAAHTPSPSLSSTVQNVLGAHHPLFDQSFVKELMDEMRVNAAVQKGADDVATDVESTAPLPRGGLMTMAWTTPVFRINIGSFSSPSKPFDVTAFNTAIAASVLKHYELIVEKSKSTTKSSTTVTDASEATNANQLFYEWQSRGGWSLLASQTEMKQLVQVVQFVSDIFLQVIGMDEAFIGNRSKSLGAWATVHHGCMAHLRHTHPDNLLSVVYYVKTPPDAGKILLEDPRGPLPPFDNRFSIKPRQGDIIMFPSWLTHDVMPTPGGAERISIAFNVAGDWETTSNIRNSFEVNTDR